MGLADEFPEIITPDQPLAPFTHLKVGGPAQFLARPRSAEELSALMRHCSRERLPLRVLGGGYNLLVRDEGVTGVVVRLAAPAFTGVAVEGRRVRAGAGAELSALISQAARHNLAGFEALVGIPCTVGGALRCNAGERTGAIGQSVRWVEVLDEGGRPDRRERDELRFADHQSNLDDPVILAAEFELEPDAVDAIVKRMRKAWILRQGSQPYSFQAASRMFQDPRGYRAAALVEQAGLAQTRVGGAEVSDRNANFVIAHPGAAARDVLRLIDLVQSRVREETGIDLEQELIVW
jgi:UDP-N-acetylmuramate dehydrogenase